MEKNVSGCGLEIVSSNNQLCLFIKKCSFAKKEKKSVMLHVRKLNISLGSDENLKFTCC